MTLVMGIDGGGTRTVAVVVDGALQELGRGRAGPANCHSVGLAAARDALRAAAEEACRTAGCQWHELSALGCGLAGAGRERDQLALRQALVTALPIVPFVLTHDAEIALIGGAGGREGVVVISGTGSVAFGRNAMGAGARAGGWGPILDDAGSGHWIGHRALRSAVRGYEGRGPSTALTEDLLSALDLPRMEDLIYWANRADIVQEIAGLAPRVAWCARGGDEVARQILEQAGGELAGLVEVVLRRLGMIEYPCDVVLSGGALRHQPLVAEALYARLAGSAPLARAIWPQREPVMGAALLALMAVEAYEPDPD